MASLPAPPRGQVRHIPARRIPGLATPSSTTLSHSTIVGLGSTSGAAIMKVGELALKGADYVHMQCSLASIDLKSRLFSKDGPLDFDENTCATLLEWSRTGLYPKRVSQHAWGHILFLIFQGTVDCIIRILLEWPEKELQIFLLNTLSYMPLGWIVNPNHDMGQIKPKTLQKHFRHLQHPRSGLAVQLVRFYLKLTEAASSRMGEESDSSSILSESSFVSASGRLVTGCSFPLDLDALELADMSLDRMVHKIVQDRMSTISTIFRIHLGCTSPSKEIMGLHGEVLEIFRYHDRDRCIYLQCQELVFTSISRFHAVSLVRHLMQWPIEDLRRLVTEIILWMEPFASEHIQDPNSLPKAFRQYLTRHNRSRHPVVPFLHFLTHLALTNSVAAEILLEVNIVGMLRMMCIYNFPNPLSHVNTPLRMDGVAQSDVYAVVIMFLGALSTHPSVCAKLLHDRDTPRWFLSLYHSHEFIGLPDAPLLQSTWIELDKPLTKFTLVAVEHVLRASDCNTADYLPLEGVHRDTICVLRDPHSEQDMRYSAADSFLRSVAMGGEYSRILWAVLSEKRSEDTQAIIRAVISSLGLISPDIPSVVRCAQNGRGIVAYLKDYVTNLANSYVDEVKMHTVLKAELVGSQACNARYMITDNYRTSEALLLTDGERDAQTFNPSRPSYVVQITTET